MSDYYLQLKYAKLVGASLSRFKIRKPSPFLAVARCPLCGDSAKSKTKTRFYMYEIDKSINTICHNCGHSSSLFIFLKENFKQLFDEWIFETYRTKSIKKKDDVDGFVPPKIIQIGTSSVEDNSVSVEETKPEVSEDDTNRKFVLELPYTKDLPSDHPANIYIANRKLPIYPYQVADKFYEFAQTFNGEMEIPKKDERRLVIPFFDRKGNVYAFQGRDLSGKSKLKYITITVDPKTPKIFGVDRLNLSEEVIVVEGPLDSLFLPNCIASVNASLVSTAKKLTKFCGLNQNRMILVLDNEPRNKDIHKQYQKAIDEGYRIVIWPNIVNEKEDINDMVLSGKDPLNIIKKNTFSGLMAQLKFNAWRKT